MTERHCEPWLRIDTYDELVCREPEIVERIAQTRNGGNLFMIHPFMLLEDIGVQLSDSVREELKRMYPRLLALSPTPYEALKRSREEQPFQIEIKSLVKGGRNEPDSRV